MHPRAIFGCGFRCWSLYDRAYWFTASTSVGNPAVTLARSATNTFAGIRPAAIPGFISAQLASAAGATLFGPTRTREHPYHGDGLRARDAGRQPARGRSMG